MTASDILEQLRHLPPAQRLAVVESAVHEIRESLTGDSRMPARIQAPKLRRAAKSLLSDYQADKELTAFTALDGEPVHA